MAAAGGHHDASSCSTAASEQSDRKKRPSPSCDEDPNFKPYECRFCSMKFAKSQALGGHMNRHRQEREREQVDNARHLLMMQQDHTSPRLIMSGPNAPSTALSKFTHAHLPRSSVADTGSLRDGIRLGSSPSVLGSVSRSLIHSSPFPSSLGASSLTFNLGSSSHDNAPNPLSSFNLDGMIPTQYHARPQIGTYSGALNTTMSSFSMQQPPPLNVRPLNQQDFMMSAPYDKAMQLSMFSFEPNTNTILGSSNLEASPSVHHSQAHDASILCGSAEGTSNFMAATNRSFLQHRHDMKSEEKFSQQSELSNMGAAINHGFQFIPFPGVVDEVVRTSLPPANLSIDFNSSSVNQLDQLSWLHKSQPPLNDLSAPPNETYHQQELEDNTETKIDEASFTDASNEQKTKWDLTLPSHNDPATIDTKSDVAAINVEGASTLSFEADFSHVAANLDGSPKGQIG